MSSDNSTNIKLHLQNLSKLEIEVQSLRDATKDSRFNTIQEELQEDLGAVLRKYSNKLQVYTSKLNHEDNYQNGI